MNTSRSPRALAVLAVALSGTLLVGCSGDQNPGGSGPASPTASQSNAGTPFSSTLDGPETARPGETLTATLTNTGRLPDAYLVVIEPGASATVPQPEHRLSPGESVKIRIRVRSVPFDVHLRSIGGGAPDVVALTVS